MPKSRTFRVFVSSTFDDLKAERDELQRLVFPKLRRLCEAAGCRFQAVDLRWGVSSEASLDQQAMRICLDELQRCQKISPKPNFIVLLGDRYGWRPLPSEIPANEFAAIRPLIVNDIARALLDGWYELDKNAVPQTYVLLPRSGSRWMDDATWGFEVERTLQKALALAATAAGIGPDRLWRYVASATEQEIQQGALAVADASEHVFCFLRDIRTSKGLRLADDVPDDEAVRRYLDMIPVADHWAHDREAFDLLEELREKKLAPLGSDNVYRYQTQWAKGGITTDHLERLCAEVESRLTRVLKEQIGQLDAVSEQDREAAAHADFRRKRAEHFVGRTDAIAQLVEFVRAGSGLLAVSGASGSGKSTLLARVAELCAQDSGGTAVMVRFIGATPLSGNLRTLLSGLCIELGEIYQSMEPVPGEVRDLIPEFARRLALAAQHRPVALLLDAVDQLDSLNEAHALGWLPRDPSPGVKLIVSALDDEGPEGDCCRTLRQLIGKGSLLEIQPLELLDGTELLHAWLGDARRTLQPLQEAAVLRAFEMTGLPLYLKLAFEEARRWKSYDDLPCLPDGSIGLQQDIPTLLQDVLARLEDDRHHGRMLVERALGYLACGRGGLAEDELIDLLSRDGEVMDSFRRRSPRSPPVDRLPAVVWSRLYADVEAYLSERVTGSAELLGFYHRQLEEAVRRRYLEGPDGTAAHARAADYFRGRADPHKDGSWSEGDVRGLSELPYHLAASGQFTPLANLLIDLRYVAERCERLSPHALLADYELLPNDAPDAARQMQAFIRRHVQNLVENPGSLFSLVHFEGPPPAQAVASELLTGRLWRKPWLRITPRPLPLPQVELPNGLGISVTRRFSFPVSCAADLAASRRLVLRVKRLGQIAMIDLERMEELSHTLAVRPLRPVGLFVSDDARLLAVAFENGEADILRLINSDDGPPAATERLTTLKYLLPEMDAPVMCWRRHELLYQPNARSLGFWTESGQSSERLITLPPLASGELAGTVRIDATDVILTRRVNASSIVCLAADGAIAVLNRERLIPTCLCPVGTNQVAIGWSNNTICLYQISPQIAPGKSIQVEEEAERITLNGERLVWISNRAHLFAWAMHSSTTPMRLMHDESLFPSNVHAVVFRLEPNAGGSLEVVANARFADFQLAESAASEVAIRDLYETAAGQALAIQHRQDGLWLSEELTGRQLRLADAAEAARRPQCGTDSRRFLLAAHGSESIMLDLASGLTQSCRGLPQPISSVVGDEAGGGFWMCDRADRVYRVSPEGECRQAAKIPLKDASLGHLQRRGNLLIWFGHCHSHTQAGTDCLPAFVFYRLRGNALEQVGHRTFLKNDGSVEAWDFEPYSDRLLVVASDVVRGQFTVRCDSPDNFIKRREQNRIATELTKAIIRVRLCESAARFAAMGKDGSLSWFDVVSLSRLASLRPSVPFTDLAIGSAPQNSVLLVQGGTRPVLCELEVPLWA